MTREARLMSGIILITVPTIQYGGYFCQAYNLGIWRTSCEAPLVMPIRSNPRPAPRCPSASLPEVHADGNDSKIARFGGAGDHACGHNPVLRNLLRRSRNPERWRSSYSIPRGRHDLCFRWDRSNLHNLVQRQDLKRRLLHDQSVKAEGCT